MPTILPGEKLSDFAARVDQAMPLSGIAKRHAVAVPGLKIRETRTTKHEKHLRRLQKGWREEEARLLEKEAEEREERDAAMEELEEQWRALEAEAGPRKKRKGNKKGGKGVVEEEEDPWAVLNRKVKEERKRNPLETVEAPPVLTQLRPKFKVYGGATVSVENVPGAAGSLRRREELREERESIVEQYRRLMAEKRGNNQNQNL
ncbi:Calcineurin subunit B [Ascosphaera pollenicola]|nr:Calcineurin subunit B [Ascosphaera pollenicola]